LNHVPRNLGIPISAKQQRALKPGDMAHIGAVAERIRALL